jgi:hypothetical protein
VQPAGGRAGEGRECDTGSRPEAPTDDEVVTMATRKRSTQASDLRKCEYAVDIASNVRFFPTPRHRVIHVPVILSLPANFWGAR